MIKVVPAGLVIHVLKEVLSKPTKEELLSNKDIGHPAKIKIALDFLTKKGWIEEGKEGKLRVTKKFFNFLFKGL